MSHTEKTPVLELKALVFDPREDSRPVDLALPPGGLAYLSGFSRSLHLLGIHPPSRGQIRFRGRTWEERPLAEIEHALGHIGTVVNPRSHPSRIWIGNLDVDENVHLASQFDPARTSESISARATSLARTFGLEEGLPATRPADTEARDLVLSQWVRAFLPDPLDLLILENPTESVSPANIAALLREIARVRARGTAVLWIDEESSLFSNLEIPADFRLE